MTDVSLTIDEIRDDRERYAAAGSSLTSAHTFHLALTNHEPWDKRYREAWGVITFHATDTVQGGAAIYGADWHDWHDSVYLLDDGESVRPYYVAAWRDAGTYDHPQPGEHRSHLILHPMPTGERHASWQLGPRRCYHVKLTGRVTLD